MSRCDLYLENYQDHYVGGQTIVGRVQCTFTSDKETHGIVVRIKGEATTHWTETESHYNASTKRNESRTVSYYGSHMFFDNEINLLPNHGGNVTIRPGVYNYPFSYTLPSDLPSSYHHNYGKVKYNIKAVVKRPLLKFNYEAESEFKILSLVNLNKDASLRNPESRSKEKHTYFCCWSKGNIQVEANIPKTGVALGERLPLHISVSNLAQTNVESIKCTVRKSVEFKVTSPSHKTRYDKDTIYTDQYSDVGAHGSNTYDKTIMIDNASLIENSINCDIINVKYKLKIIFVLSGMHTNIELDLPLTIGHIPLADLPPPAYNYNSVMATASAPQEVTAPTSYGFVLPTQPAYNPQMAVPQNGGNIGFGYPAMAAPSVPYFNAGTSNPNNVKDKDDWEFVDDFGNQDLPTYDQAMVQNQGPSKM